MRHNWATQVLSSVTVVLGLTAVCTSYASAQALYEPYYYSTREQYQTMSGPGIVAQHQPTIDVSQQVNYVPDSRLDPQTNKRLAQGDYPPVPSSVQSTQPVRPASTMPLTTIGGIDVGLQGGEYNYNEPNLDKSTGGKIGAFASATLPFGDQNEFFGTLDFRYAFGQVDYSGSGVKNNVNDYLFDVRGVVGRDFTWKDSIGVSPYIGFGYRNLYDDPRGLTSTGAAGYRRESQYFYIPLGVSPRLRIDGDSRLAANVEFDYFVHGEQTTDLGDVGNGWTNFTAQQDTGYGLRGNLLYETGDWSFGPYFNYWDIRQSSLKLETNSQTHASTFWFEPYNNTLELGLQLKYRFVTFY